MHWLIWTGTTWGELLTGARHFQKKAMICRGEERGSKEKARSSKARMREWRSERRGKETFIGRGSWECDPSHLMKEMIRGGRRNNLCDLWVIPQKMSPGNHQKVDAWLRCKHVPHYSRKRKRVSHREVDTWRQWWITDGNLNDSSKGEPRQPVEEATCVPGMLWQLGNPGIAGTQSKDTQYAAEIRTHSSWGI